MFGFKLGFGQPLFLVLLALLPVLWVFSYRSLAGLGRVRRLAALGLRTLLVTMIIFALAEVQLQQISERMTVIYLLDQSASIPAAKRDAMLNFVINDVLEHRNAARHDRVGVIVFGKEAMIEMPPMEGDVPSVGVLETARQIHTDATDLASALKLAQASFKEDSAKRIVIVTDGNENLGDARAVAPALADQGIGIDVVPVELNARGEVAVDKVSLPSDVRKGQPIEARIAVVNYSDQNVAGKLRIVRRSSTGEELLDQQDVELEPGKNIYSIPHEIDSPDVYTYRAVFTADDPQQDIMVQNNEATAFTHVRGKGRILLIENWTDKGEYDYLVQRLRANNLEVNVLGSDELFTSLAQLQGYDAVILANVPRSSSSFDGDDVKHFSDEQIRMLVRNVEQMGAGLIMMGGPNSFGAGGWTNTELEKAMPVDFQIQNDKVRAVGALVLMMHASELAQGNFWQKKVAEEAIKALGPMDYCGLVHWQNQAGRDGWLWGAPQGLIRVSGKRNHMLAQLSRMAPGDMPDFEPSMQLSLNAFNSVKQAAAKHMIVISDGDPTPPRNSTVLAYRNAKIQISTVAIGTHGPAGSSLLQQLANDTGGKYYVVRNPQALPRIYQAEARKVARPLVYEPEGGVQPQVVYNHEMHNFLDAGSRLPRIDGFVFTTVKDSQLVEVSIRSPKPAEPRNSTILASWQYGQGRTVVFTSDAGKRWASSWTDWENYDRFFTQMVRWCMRPVDDQASITVASEMRDGKVKVAITALGPDDSYLNNLDMAGTAVAPDLSTFEVRIRQVAPGRYEAEFDAGQSGDYLLTVVPGTVVDPDTGQRRPRAPIISGVTVPYSAEFRDRETNLALLRALAGIKPQGGDAGMLFNVSLAADREPNAAAKKATDEADTFRHTLKRAVSIQDVWPLFLLIAAAVFFADIFVRRVTVGWEWTRPIWAWFARLLGREEQPAEVGERLQRLRSRKEQVAGELDERRAAARFEPQMDQTDADLSQAGGQAATRPRAETSRPEITAEAEDESYTSRLMKAKKDAWKKKKDKSE